MDSRDNALQIIKKCGMKATMQRLLIVETLMEEAGHFTALELHNKVSAKNADINFSTIYRNLEQLVEAGVLRKMMLNDNAAYYELNSPGHHHHMICRKCGKAVEIDYCPYDDMESRLLEEKGFQPQDHIFEIYGYCKNCIKK